MAARDKQLLDTAYGQMAELKRLIDSDGTLLNFLSAPQVLEEKKRALLESVFASRLERLLVEFLGVLVEKHRVNFLPEIIESFNALVEKEKGISRAMVISTSPLTDSERNKLVERLAAKTKQKILLEQKVDPSLIGGMIVMIGGEIMDGSVRHQLQQLKEQLTNIRVH